MVWPDLGQNSVLAFPLLGGIEQNEPIAWTRNTKRERNHHKWRMGLLEVASLERYFNTYLGEM